MSGPSRQKRFADLLGRHAVALGYVFSVLLPIILKTGRRPVIFSRWSGMGDIICSIPASRELMKRHPGATFIYNCYPDFAAVPKMAGVAEHFTSFLSIGIVGYWYRFLLVGFYHFSHGDDTAGKVAQEPMVAEFLRQFGLPLSEEHPRLDVTPAVRQKALSILAEKGLDANSLVLIHPGPSWKVKEWPHENWTLLVAELRKHGFTNVAQMGVGRYSKLGEVEVPLVPGAVSLLNAFSVEECLAAIAQAKLFIGIDSGLLHMAASTRTPAVGIWGSTSPQFFYPESVRKNFVVSQVECAGCYHRLPRLHWETGCPYEIKCMKTIRVDEVLQASLKKLGSMPPMR